MTWVLQSIKGDEGEEDSWAIAQLEDGRVTPIYWCDEEEQALECQMAMSSYDHFNSTGSPEMPTQLVIFTPSRVRTKPRTTTG